jgi:hypothetical protein
MPVWLRSDLDQFLKQPRIVALDDLAGRQVLSTEVRR